MPILGAHMSIAGGYYRAVEEAAEAGCECVQLFTKNNNQWSAKPVSEDDVIRFRDCLRESDIAHPLSHSSYLINLASPDDVLRQKSVDGMVVELQRAALLGIGNVVMHPGAFTSSSEAEGIAAIIRSMLEIFSRTEGLKTRILLENTAGQGSVLGWQLEQLELMLDGLQRTSRVGICIDTCHAFAAGYNLATESGYEDFMRQLEGRLGLTNVKALHLNDSKKGLGSRVDRHQHIGEGAIGSECFRRILNDSRWSGVPMYLETEKGERDGESLDRINLGVLRSLIEPA